MHIGCEHEIKISKIACCGGNAGFRSRSPPTSNSTSSSLLRCLGHLCPRCNCPGHFAVPLSRGMALLSISVISRALWCETHIIRNNMKMSTHPTDATGKNTRFLGRRDALRNMHWACHDDRDEKFPCRFLHQLGNRLRLLGSLNSCHIVVTIHRFHFNSVWLTGLQC